MRIFISTCSYSTGKLRRLIAIELKIGHFKAAYKGQMELYLRWLEQHEKEVSEEPPLGLILCAGADQEQIRLLQLDKSGIHVSGILPISRPAKCWNRN